MVELERYVKSIPDSDELAMLYIVVSWFRMPTFTSNDDQCMLEKYNSCADCSMARFT